MARHRILIVEDETDIAGLIKHTLERRLPDERRDRTPHTQGSYSGERLMADFEAVAIAVDGAPVRLARREFELLRYLVHNKNRVVSRDRLLERVWGDERCVETRSVDVHVGRLRTKLRTAGRQIETVIGLGYRCVD